MRPMLLVGFAAILVALPTAAAQGAFSSASAQDALLLGAPMPPGGRLARLASLAPLDPIDRGEAVLLEEALANPLALLELPSVSSGLLRSLALQRVGDVVGPRVGEIPADEILAANALLGPGESLPASSLLGVHDRGSIGNEPRAQQAADAAALDGPFGSSP